MFLALTGRSRDHHHEQKMPCSSLSRGIMSFHNFSAWTRKYGWRFWMLQNRRWRFTEFKVVGKQ